MSSWYSSWLPGIPSLKFSLPTSIQNRFISFLLKKSLGHLLKPGQLDIAQIESQIGSGYVQIKDIEVDNDAINNMLIGLPVRLHDGKVSSITARIPWPNPLTSTIGLSTRSLHLIFYLSPTSSPPTPTNNLVDSVFSVAESFVHGELSSKEEDAFRQSFHPDLDQSFGDIPGGMDPFTANPGDEGLCPDSDPTGVSLFATLIERLLARFDFDALDSRITLIHPGNMSLTVSISELRYGTNLQSVEPPALDVSSHGKGKGETRTLSVSGLRLSAINLRPLNPSSSLRASFSSSAMTTSQHSAETERPHLGSPSSSSSSIDEETQFMMSQSLAFLPPRPISPAPSVASSMYESAVSTPEPPTTSSHAEGQEQLQKEGTDVGQTEEVNSGVILGVGDDEAFVDKTFLSFGTEPIVLKLTTPPPPIVAQQDPSSPEFLNFRPDIKDQLEITLTVGSVGCALCAWHVRGLVVLSNSWASHNPRTNATSDSQPKAKPAFGFEVDFRVRTLVLMLLAGSDPSNLKPFFDLPLIPPPISCGYARIHLDNLFVQASFVPNEGSKSPTLVGKHRQLKPTSSQSHWIKLTMTLDDLSAFAFSKRAVSSVGKEDENSRGLLASPILITDPNLASQYSPTHLHPNSGLASENYPHLPSFDIADWTEKSLKSSTSKISGWRTRPKQVRPERPREPSSSNTVKDVGIAVKPRSEAIIVNFLSGIQRTPDLPKHDMEIKLVPVHVFLDAGLLLKAIPFVEEALMFPDELTSRKPASATDSSEDEWGSASDEEGNGDGTPLDTPRTNAEKHRRRERDRLERLVLDDLDLELDYRQKLISEPTYKVSRGHIDRKRLKRKRRRQESAGMLNISAHVAVVRIEVRCPPPLDRRPRSGSIVLDFHGLRISNAPSDQSNQRPRFAELGGSQQLYPENGCDVLSRIECQRIVLSLSLSGESKARGVLSIGPLVKVEEPLESTQTPPFGMIQTASDRTPRRLLFPTVIVTQTSSTNKELGTKLQTLVICIEVPSAHACLRKETLDGLQYWADDISQLFERVHDPGKLLREDDQAASLIGSRFFAKSRGGSATASVLTTTQTQPRSKIVIEATVSETFARMLLPREHEAFAIRPFDVSASDTDILVELKPEGKDETVITAGVMALEVVDLISTSSQTRMLSLTSPRSLISSPKPLLKLRFVSLVVPETSAKESRVKISLWGFTYDFYPEFSWATDIGLFVKAPLGAFESVVPSERTRLSLQVKDGAIRARAPSNSGALALYIDSLDFSTDIVGQSPESSFKLSVASAAILLLDDLAGVETEQAGNQFLKDTSGVGYWRAAGYALLAGITGLDLSLVNNSAKSPPEAQVTVSGIGLQLHLCADTGGALGMFAADMGSAFKLPPGQEPPKPRRGPATITQPQQLDGGLMRSIDNLAFKQAPQVGPAPDMIFDDLPTNLDYIVDSYGTAAGLREMVDDDLDEFDTAEQGVAYTSSVDDRITSRVGGETIKVLRPEGLHIIENYFDRLPDDAESENSLGETTLRVRVRNGAITLFLYDGYDWLRTRRTIENEVKEMRRRLAKIRQFVADGQKQDPVAEEETSALLFNSVYIGLEQDINEMEPGALIAAIDEELRDDTETGSQSSWQSLRPQQPGKSRNWSSSNIRGKRLYRSKGPSVEFIFSGLDAEIDQFKPGEVLVSRVLAAIKDVEILDHIRTSTWKKFLTPLRADSRGNVRESESNMVRVELKTVNPVPEHPSEEARLRAKILPLRLHVDQDALDFLKAFFSFKDADATPAVTPEEPSKETYFQLAEIFPVDLKLDYKPRRVDYRALKAGKTIELMNFFHFDGAEMTLRHITLSGVTGWARLGDMLNDLWTPDVKATQLVEVISGVAPIRSVVNVGSGLADLVLLPIAQYKKDGRIVRGVQKGTTAFVKSTAMEAIKLGARLATGTQVILEQTEGVLGGQFKQPITTEALQNTPAELIGSRRADDEDELYDEDKDLISKYAEQPIGIREGVQSGYRSLQKNLNSAAQTILAVPMEVYERSGNEGAVRSVVRAVPIAVLRPMIGATEAVSKTLLGLHNSLDPNVRHDNEAKYKHR